MYILTADMAKYGATMNSEAQEYPGPENGGGTDRKGVLLAGSATGKLGLTASRP